MTVTQAIKNWLAAYGGGVEFDESLSTDQLAAGAEAYGLFKTPTDTVTPYVNGERDITTYRQMLIRQPSQTERMRVSNQAWMEDLERWIHTANLRRDMPELGSGRECYAVAVANTFYLQDQTEMDSVYQINIQISYVERIVTA